MSDDEIDLDPNVLDRLRGHIGAENVERLTGLFRENVRERQAAAAEAYRTGDQRALVVAFHSIKGSAQLVGARKLESLVARFEEQAREGNIASVDEALEQVAAALRSVEAALEGN